MHVKLIRHVTIHGFVQGSQPGLSSMSLQP